ncbi:MerR family transcriptional regulator [Cryptosporangium phraense]|uniref:MerR family transcriptional regulator n=1 Tax=Cryptosporangium phraense TaxID=2593070 RepID=UPI0014785D19|nr:MerR family transcriptional regulator [Cryptosporangium phraense]
MTGRHYGEYGESGTDVPLPAELTVDQLAELCRVSVRLVRAHQSRRLLHPPRRVGRRSVYDHSHIDRLELIQRLQKAGFSLAAIRALLQTGHNAPELALAWHAEGLAMRFPSTDDTSDPDLQVEPEGVADLHAQPGAWEALESYGLVSRDPDGNWYGTHPVLVAVGRRARELGMPSTEITRLQLRVAAAALELSREIIESFSAIFRAAGGGPDRKIEDYASMSSVATALVTATFEVQLSRLVRGVVDGL